MSTADRPQVVYLWGDDEWAMERFVATLATELERDTGAAPERWRVNGRETSAEAIAERVSIAPMFGGGTVAIVTNPSQLVRSKALRESLDRVIASVAPGNALVFFEFDTTDGRKRPKSLTDLEAAVIRAGGAVRPCRAPNAGEMPSWIGGRAKELGVELAPEAAKEIARRIGSFASEGDVDRRGMGAMAVGELGKLALYRGAEPVTVEDVRALVAEVVPDSLWALSDAVALRRAERVGPALDRALETQPEQVLLVLLHRRLRELLIAADARATGTKPGDLVKLIGGSPYVVQRRAEQATAWTVPELVSALEGLLELDRMAKHADVEGTTDGQRRMAWVAWVAERVAPRPRGP
ncbi:MAG TPA: DNA polymerase III subunit delta, partial [Candidatus Limnocylindrales bacterium]